MLQVHLEGGRVEVRDVPVPARPPGHAWLRLLAAGLCNTDLELQRGYYGFSGTPGHEFVGEVVEAEDSRWLGRRVVGEINLACGRCDACRRDLGRHCAARTVLGILGHPGAFSEYFTLPEANLFEVPGDVPTPRAVFTEPLAAACEILDQVAFPPRAEVAVLGDGKLGLLIAAVLHLHGLAVSHYGRHEAKLAHSAARGIRTFTQPDRKFDFVVEATGSQTGLDQAITMTHPRGSIVLKSTVHGPVQFDAARVIVDEITLIGSRCGRFEAAIPLLNAIAPERLVSATYQLKDAPAAFEKAAAQGVLKVLFACGEEC